MKTLLTPPAQLMPDFQKDLESWLQWLWLNTANLNSLVLSQGHSLSFPSAAWLSGSRQVLQAQISWGYFETCYLSSLLHFEMS